MAAARRSPSTAGSARVSTRPRCSRRGAPQPAGRGARRYSRSCRRPAPRQARPDVGPAGTRDVGRAGTRDVRRGNTRRPQMAVPEDLRRGDTRRPQTGPVPEVAEKARVAGASCRGTAGAAPDVPPAPVSGASWAPPPNVAFSVTTQTRLRPPRLAWYKAPSAAARSSASWAPLLLSHLAPSAATPIEM